VSSVVCSDGAKVSSRGDLGCRSSFEVTVGGCCHGQSSVDEFEPGIHGDGGPKYVVLGAAVEYLLGSVPQSVRVTVEVIVDAGLQPVAVAHLRTSAVREELVLGKRISCCRARRRL
jgi:hypothetical protein